MITAKQAEEKIRNLLSDSIDDIIEEAMHLYRSGAIDPQSYDNEYVLPRILLSETLRRRSAAAIDHLCPKNKKALYNLRHF